MSNNIEKVGFAGALTVIILALLGIIGWILNIIQVVSSASADAEVTTLFIIKCVGVIFWPIGAVLGWFG